VEKHDPAAGEYRGIDAAIFMHPTTWKASGHVDNFSDPMIDNKDSKKRYRVDHLIEARIDELKKKAKNRGGCPADRAGPAARRQTISGLKQLIETQKIKCGVSGTANWTDVSQFNLMFSTQLGSVSEEAAKSTSAPKRPRASSSTSSTSRRPAA
jgi:glycyl-tRNA synthetase